MSVLARVKTVTTRDVVLEHFRLAENCHKDPVELASFVDQLYGAEPEDHRWVLIEADVSDMIRFFDAHGAFREMNIRDNAVVQRYREKLLRTPSPPGALTEADGGGLAVLDGRHRLLALRLAGKDRSRWYVPAPALPGLQALLRQLPELESSPEVNAQETA